MTKKGKVMLDIILRRSTIGQPKPQRLIAKALGLRRLHQCVVRVDHPTIRGMAEKIKHLLEVRPHAAS